MSEGGGEPADEHRGGTRGSRDGGGGGAEVDRRRRLGELLAGVLDLPPEARAAALEAATDDRSLIDEVLALVAGEDALGGFLDRPAAQALGAPSDPTRVEGPPGGGSGSAPETGSTPALDDRGTPPAAGDGGAAPLPEIPGFTLMRPLGEGGMGRVWLAREEGPGRRTVALKVVRSGLAGGELAARFAVEQQALARLNHPAIAQLYRTATTPDGLPYVVMEYVDGLPLTEYCDRHRLSLEKRLALFVDVCRGVEHAHRRQLLHRDLKPSNLLVTRDGGEGGAPRAKIIDFGIARILDDPLDAETPLTRHGTLGTPRYMSPEALAPSDGPRDLDTRTDVYSLGVVLHELLVGDRPPLAGSAGSRPLRPPSTRLRRLPEEMRREVAAARSADTPAELGRSLDGDLDWIVLKALAADRDERYGSAAELADDLERSLRDEPVLARPPGVVYRLTKLARRHRLGAALVAATAVALVAATVLTALALVRATRAERLARDEAAAARHTLDFLVDLFGAASPGESQGEEVSARTLVALGAERIDEEELAPRQRARLLHTLAGVQGNLGDYDSAVALAGEALALREAELTPLHPDVLASLDLLGTSQRRAGRLDQAEVLMERLLERSERLAAEEPGPDHRALLGDALNSLANLRWRQARLDEAVELHRRGLEIRRRLAAGSDDPEALLDVASSRNNLGVLLWARGDADAAAPQLAAALEIFEAELGEDNPRVASTLVNLGNVAFDRERYAEAEALTARSLAIAERVTGADHPQVAVALHNLGRVRGRLGRDDQAEADYRRALAIRRDTFGEAHADSLQTGHNLVALLRDTGRPDDAESELRALLEAQREAGRTDTLLFARTLRVLGELRREAGEPTAADHLLAEAEDVLRTARPSQPADLSKTLAEHGRAAEDLGEPARAVALYRDALRLSRRARPAGAAETAALEADLARLEGENEIP